MARGFHDRATTASHGARTRTRVNPAEKLRSGTFARIDDHIRSGPGTCVRRCLSVSCLRVFVAGSFVVSHAAPESDPPGPASTRATNSVARCRRPSGSARSRPARRRARQTRASPSAWCARNNPKYTSTTRMATGMRSPMIVKAHVSPGFRSYTRPHAGQRSMCWPHPVKRAPWPQCGHRLRRPRDIADVTLGAVATAAYLSRTRVPLIFWLLSALRKFGTSRSISSKYEESAGVLVSVE